MSDQAVATQQTPVMDYEALANMTDDQIEALANPPEPKPAVEGEKIGSETPAAASQEPAKPETPAVDPDAEQPAGVQTKDGAHVIPYSVLERERDRAARAEQTAQALSDQLKQLQEGKPATETGDAGAVSLTEDDLKQLDQDLPGVSKLIRAQMKMIENLTGTVTSLKQEQEVQHQVKAQSEQDVVAAAVSANPDLLAWQSAKFRPENPDPLMWDRAADMDAMLRQDTYWKDRPIAERFAKVAELVKATAPSTATTPTSPKETPEQIQARADAAIKAAGASAGIPRSSSDIPGGTAPATDEAAAMAGKTGMQLLTEFGAMTPEQIEAKLARL